MIGSSISAGRRTLADLQQQAHGLDRHLAALEHAERQDDPALTALQSAKLLVALDRLSAQLTALCDRAGEAAADLPEPPAPVAGGAGNG
jgi:hypothetical protein